MAPPPGPGHDPRWPARGDLGRDRGARQAWPGRAVDASDRPAATVTRPAEDPSLRGGWTPAGQGRRVKAKEIAGSSSLRTRKRTARLDSSSTATTAARSSPSIRQSSRWIDSARHSICSAESFACEQASPEAEAALKPYARTVEVRRADRATGVEMPYSSCRTFGMQLVAAGVSASRTSAAANAGSRGKSAMSRQYASSG